MKLYIAARYTQKEFASLIRTALLEQGHTTTSTWIDFDLASDGETAAKDFADIDRADAVLFLAANVEGMKGAYVEVGYALGKGKPVYVFPTLAPVTSCIFMHHPGVKELPRLRDLPDVSQ